MKILHLITTLEIGGAQKNLANIIPFLNDMHENIICGIFQKGGMEDIYSSKHIVTDSLDIRHLFCVQTVTKFRILMEKYKPDIIFSYLPHADLIAKFLGKAYGAKMIVCSNRCRLPKLKFVPVWLFNSLTMPLADYYIFNSQSVLDRAPIFRRLQHKVAVIPSCVDTDRFAPSAKATRARKALGIPTSVCAVGCSSRLDPQKDHRSLLKAMELVISKQPNTMLVLAGDGQLRQELTKLATRLKINRNVLFLGNVKDIATFLDAIDFFVLPSLYEGMSNSLLEAMSSGKAVVVSDIGENREVLGTGTCGLSFKTGDPGSLAKRIIDLIENPKTAQMMGRNARTRAVEEYSLPKVANKYLELINMFDKKRGLTTDSTL